MSSRGRSGVAALVLSFASIASFSACDGGDAEDGGAEEETGGTSVGGATVTGGGAGRGGGSSSGGTSTGGTSTGGRLGSGGGVTGGSNNAAGASGRGGASAAGGTASNAGSMNGGAGGPEPPDGVDGKSPYEIECHGDTAMCGNPTALLCLGLRIGEEVLGYSCANECQSDANCSEDPSSTDASAGCIDFVNKKYCLLVCKNGEEEASCPTGMYCYVYEGTTTGYCLWR